MSQAEMVDPRPRRQRIDRQITGLAGEFFVAGELLKRGLQTSITFGNAKAIDIVAHHPATLRTFTVQVKALRSRNVFPIRLEAVNGHHTYVFVILNRPGDPVRFFIVPGATIQRDSDTFRGLTHAAFPGIDPRDLEPYEDNWVVFEALA